MTRAEFEQRLQAAARGWLGVRFLHNGRTKSQGVDCLGLVICLLREVLGTEEHIPDGDGNAYGPDWYLHTPETRYLAGLTDNGVPVTEADLLPGDVLYFRTGMLGRSKTDAITHGGVWLGDHNFIHAITGREVGLADLRQRAWRGTLAGIIRPTAVLDALGETA